MNPDFLKLEPSRSFQAFGFGSIVILATLMTSGNLDNESNLPDFSGYSTSFPEFVAIPLVVFSAYVAGLGVQFLGHMIAGDCKEFVGSAQDLRAAAALAENEKVWVSYLDMLRRADFSAGCLGTSFWVLVLFALEVINSLFNEIMPNRNSYIGLAITTLLVANFRQNVRFQYMSFLVFMKKVVEKRLDEELGKLEQLKTVVCKGSK